MSQPRRSSTSGSLSDPSKKERKSSFVRQRIQCAFAICIAAVITATSGELEDMAALQALIADGPGLQEAIESAKRVDRVDGSFSVTGSAALTTSGTSADIEQGVASAVSKRHGWQHQELKRSAIDVRVFVDGSWGLVGVRLLTSRSRATTGWSTSTDR